MPAPRVFRGFTVPQLPKPEYQALRWAQGELQCSQWEVVCLGVRLVALLLQGKVDIEALHRIGQRGAVQGLLEAFHGEPSAQEHRAPIIDPHATIKPSPVRNPE